MKLAVIGSGSAGNCVVLGSKKTGYWLVDAGLSAKQIRVRLEAIGVSLSCLRGIFLTHEHKDHIGGLKVLLKKLSVPVYASVMTQEYLVSQLQLEARWILFEPGQRFLVGPLEVDAVRIPHDATDPVGFIFHYEQRRMAVMTDLGYASESLIERLKGVEVLYLEANYDIELLELDQKRPWSIKQRIASRHGHLSNDQALEVTQALMPTGLREVAYGHLSRDCNTPDCLHALIGPSCEGLQYHVSTQAEVTPWLTLISEPPKVAPSPRPASSPLPDSASWEQPSLF